ncbi:MAG: hypothetical protein P4L51_23605 [Puia sp.]|nr:hypothetical protein [Puia sp.]
MTYTLQEVQPYHFDIVDEGGDIVALAVETPTEGWFVLLGEAFSNEGRFPGRIVGSVRKLSDVLPFFLKAMETDSSIS